jgi:predicted DNA-binding protein with PD1-like motif
MPLFRSSPDATATGWNRRLSDGTTRGGHLMAGTVRPTLEGVMSDTPAHLRRKKEPDLGIALIDVDAGNR